jgi:hypothetical protein
MTMMRQEISKFGGERLLTRNLHAITAISEFFHQVTKKIKEH